ncbi:C-5 cytosine-specific DNA methylase [Streptomyces sp. F-3]|uniref:DNA (cytosine-5-)-methyltransferase n=2 Tax=Streptomyces TaxID=1883 RepID=A0ABN1STC4_9ACTN|nr:C-5 cytosine-specific DNA methylase [Streptomyces sp. F-3]
MSTGPGRLHFDPMTSPATPDSAFADGSRDVEKIHVLDLFAGPGGLDVAAHFLGWESIGIEWDANACETRYSAGLPTIHADVRTMRTERFDELPDDINVLVGGPPCQTFSVAGNGAGRRALTEVKSFIKRLVAREESSEDIDRELAALGDPRTALVLEPLRWIMAAIENGKPYRAVVLEQVPSVLPVWNAYKEVLESGVLPGGIEYRAECKVLRMEEYGVPQTRRRAVLVARLAELGRVSLPRKTHRAFTRQKDETAPAGLITFDEAVLEEAGDDEKSPSDGEGRAPWVSMGEALRETSRELGRPEPYVVVSNYGSGGDPKNRGRRTSDQPAFTVTGKISRNVVETPDGRPLPRFTIPEAGVLQTFPANFPWGGRDRAQQVGNAVPPRFGVHLLAAALGLGEARVAEALGRMHEWPRISQEERERLRKIGCGDGDKCPTQPPHPPVTPLR